MYRKGSTYSSTSLWLAGTEYRVRSIHDCPEKSIMKQMGVNFFMCSGFEMCFAPSTKSGESQTCMSQIQILAPF